MKKHNAISRLSALARGRQLAALQDRVAILEEQVAEARRHQLRTAELTDVVEALLLPLARRDDEALEQVLRDYTDTLG